MLSIINITQNLLSSRNGKTLDPIDTTVYCNTKVLVLFNNPIDNTVLTIVGKRLKPSGSSRLIQMLNDVIRKYRYVVIHADVNRPEEMKYTSDIFAQTPVPHQKVFQLKEEEVDSE